MKVLIIDSGGRGSAIAWQLAHSKRVKKLYLAPGNGGVKDIAENVPIQPTEIEKLLQFAESKKIDLTVASQDDSLALGIVNIFQSHGLRIFGPTKGAAEIESSKVFAKNLMVNTSVPTASFRSFTDSQNALMHVFTHDLPMVVKASGLASGKGVYICRTTLEAEAAIYKIMVKRVHKDAGDAVVIEKFLDGPEVSIHAFCDGKDFILFPPAQDHKPVFEGSDENTGGMGTIVPVPWFSPENMQEVSSRIVGPILRELHKMGRPFAGCLYPGLKMTPSGPVALEFNARPGDPETQSYMRLLKSDLLDILLACVDGNLAKCKVEWHPGFAVCIVAASEGYPGNCRLGLPISGIEDAEKISGVEVFHSGTTIADGRLRTSSGRVLGVTARGDTLSDALGTAYEAIRRIKFDGMKYRDNIGARSLAVMAKSQAQRISA